MSAVEKFQIKLPQFEGPFDLLLFFIHRDELDIYDIPIHKITADYLAYIHQLEALHLEQASEFILFAATLIRIKARMLLPRKELDEEGNEIDARTELVDKLLIYKKFKEAALELSGLEMQKLQYHKRGNVSEELQQLGEAGIDGSELESISLYRLMNAFERVTKRLQERNSSPQHVVVKYNFSLESQRHFLMNAISRAKRQSFETIFLSCQNRIHAIFNLLAMLELIQQKYLKITVGVGKNNFFVEWNEHHDQEIADDKNDVLAVVEE